MTTLSQENVAVVSATQQDTMPFIGQVLMMTRRSLMVLLRLPDAIIPSLAISIFFLLIYEGSLGGITQFAGPMQGVDYLAFTLPVAIISSALNGVAGQAMVRDVASGYFNKLLLTPISRSALLLGHIISSGIVIMFQTLVIFLIAFLMGLEVKEGVLGVAIVLFFSLMTGVGFGGFTVGVALRTGNPGATQGASFIFFPLLFLSTTYLPMELLDGWFKVAAQLNPITYILDASRELLIYGWDTEIVLKGFAACVVLTVFPFMFAMSGLRARVRRK
jgi:ABC-2 type transport system permease protein